MSFAVVYDFRNHSIGARIYRELKVKVKQPFIAWLLRNRFRFGIRFLLLAVTLTAILMVLMGIPLYRFKEARVGSLAAAGMVDIDPKEAMDQWCSSYGITPPPKLTALGPKKLPVWLQSFAGDVVNVRPDCDVSRIRLRNDDEVELFAKHHQRFTSLLYVSLSGDITPDSLATLQRIISKSQSIKFLLVFDDFPLPKGWLRSLTGIRSIVFCGRKPRTKPFPRKYLEEILALSNLTKIKVDGYAFDDADASVLANHAKLQFIFFSRTAITEKGRTELIGSMSGRRVEFENMNFIKK